MKIESLKRKARKIKNTIEDFEMRLSETDERRSSCSMYCNSLSNLRAELSDITKQIANKSKNGAVKLHQDVTITLDLSRMTKKEYQDKIAILMKMSDTCMTTHAYNPENSDCDILSVDEQIVLKALVL